MSDQYKAFSKALSNSVTDMGNKGQMLANKRARPSEQAEDDGMIGYAESVDPDESSEGQGVDEEIDDMLDTMQHTEQADMIDTDSSSIDQDDIG